MKIVCAFLKYDYGIKSRGESLEKRYFYPTFKKFFDEVTPFWLEENGFDEDLNCLQKKLIDFCEFVKPEIVFFVLMKNEIYNETLRKLSRKYTTVNWFCDDEWRFENFSKHIANNLSYCILTDKYSLKKYRKIGQTKVILSNWGIFEYNEKLDFNNIDYKYEVTFIGSRNRVRQWYIDSLKKMGIFVNCFGFGWEKGRISFEDMKKIIFSSKINLNISNSIPLDYNFLLTSPINFLSFIRSNKKVETIRARNFEILGYGGFELTNYVVGLEDYFEIGKEIATYTNINDLSMQIEYFLENDNLRKSILKNGYIKVKKYTYENIFKEIANKIKIKFDERIF